MKPGPGVTWCVEAWGIRIVPTHADRAREIRYPRAAIWSLVSNGNYTPEFAAELVAILDGTTFDRASAMVTETLAEWEEDGLITRD